HARRRRGRRRAAKPPTGRQKDSPHHQYVYAPASTWSSNSWKHRAPHRTGLRRLAQQFPARLMPVRNPGHWYTPTGMADVRPFQGLRFAQSVAPDLGAALSPPYDVIDATDDQRLRERHPYNVVRVELTTASVAGGSEDRSDEPARTL